MWEIPPQIFHLEDRPGLGNVVNCPCRPFYVRKPWTGTRAWRVLDEINKSWISVQKGPIFPVLVLTEVVRDPILLPGSFERKERWGRAGRSVFVVAVVNQEPAPRARCRSFIYLISLFLPGSVIPCSIEVCYIPAKLNTIFIEWGRQSGYVGYFLTTLGAHWMSMTSTTNFAAQQDMNL